MYLSTQSYSLSVAGTALKIHRCEQCHREYGYEDQNDDQQHGATPQLGERADSSPPQANACPTVEGWPTRYSESIEIGILGS